MEWMRIATRSGYEVPVGRFNCADPRAHVLVTPALGVPARFYRPLGEALRDLGYNTGLFEQRGHGESALRPARGVDFGWAEWLRDDLPAALDWLGRAHPERPCIVFGHSLGGHLGSCLVGLQPSRVQGLVLAGVSFPTPRFYPPKTAAQIRLLIALLPLCFAGLGTYPGHRLGFGGRESRGTMEGWLYMARHAAYAVPGLASRRTLAEGAARWPGRCLQLGFEDDTFSPPRAADPVTARLRAAAIDKRTLGAGVLGSAADHFRWAREGAPAVARTFDAWWAGTSA